jgi:benzylsuccinate CoA-transferase BbsF subunit
VGNPERASGGGAGGGGRWIAIGASDDSEFARLCAVAGHPEWLVDLRFADVAARKRNEDALDAAVGAWTAALDAAELEAALRQAGVTAAVVRNADDVIATEHLWERGGLVRVAHPEAGEHAQMAAPWRLNRASGGVTRPAPLLGEHSRAVLARFLGIGDEEYTRLEALGITGSGPPD